MQYGDLICVFVIAKASSSMAENSGLGAELLELCKCNVIERLHCFKFEIVLDLYSRMRSLESKLAMSAPYLNWLIEAQDASTSGGAHSCNWLELRRKEDDAHWLSNIARSYRLFPIRSRLAASGSIWKHEKGRHILPTTTRYSSPHSFATTRLKSCHALPCTRYNGLIHSAVIE
jgi:hypothetical protein